MASAFPILPSSSYYTAQSQKGGKQRNTQDSCGGPEAAVRVWQGGDPFPGGCSSRASGMQHVCQGASMSSSAQGWPNSQTAPHPSHIFSSFLSVFVQCSDTSFLSATPCESSHACPLILCSPKVRLKQTST